MKILGYSSATSAKAGESIELSLSLAEDARGRHSIEFTLENVADRAISQNFSASVSRQSPPASHAWQGFGWGATHRFNIPRDWPSGLYRLFHFDNGLHRDVLNFVVSPNPRRSARTLVHISYLRAAAYNNFGGKSFYFPRDEDAGTDRARKVSLDRPSPYPILAHDSAPDVLIQEAKLLEWLEHEGIGVDCCSSIDLHANPNLLGNYDCLVLAYHDEYWTKTMRDNCERFIRNGGNMIVLAGNTCYRQVRLEDNDRTVVFYKYANLDPLKDTNQDEVAIAWAEPPVNRPQNQMLGVGFTHGAFNLAAGNNRPYEIRFPDHWVFDGVNSQQTSRFMRYETDAAAYVDEAEGYPRVTGEEGTPINLTVLATADLRDWQSKPGRATMTIYSRNGTVFDAASTNWVDALGSDPVVTRITRNVFARLTRPIPWSWEYVGHANDATAMAALEGKLFLSTTHNKLWRRYPVGADVPWKEIGHANHVTTMSATDGHLFCIAADNRLWSRPPTQADTGWRRLGSGPGGGTRALAAAGGMLYAIDNAGALHRRPATQTDAPFQAMGGFETRSDIVALTAYGDILFASTSGDRLLRTNRDNIAESNRWHDIHHCNFSTGLAVVDWMLYVVTRENALWRIDLSALHQP